MQILETNGPPRIETDNSSWKIRKKFVTASKANLKYVRYNKYAEIMINNKVYAVLLNFEIIGC